LKIILETSRLYLRDFNNTDIEPIAKMIADIDVMRYVGSGITLPREHAEKTIENWPKYGEKHGFTNWALVRKEGDVLIGNCGFNWLPDNSDVEISYLLDKPYWNNGFATEIALSTMKYGFDRLGLKRIAGLVYPQNTASIHVLEKLGMKYEKDIRFWDVNLLLYSIELSET